MTDTSLDYNASLLADFTMSLLTKQMFPKALFPEKDLECCLPDCNNELKDERDFLVVGHNPAPFRFKGRSCYACNKKKIKPIRAYLYELEKQIKLQRSRGECICWVHRGYKLCEFCEGRCEIYIANVEKFIELYLDPNQNSLPE